MPDIILASKSKVRLHILNKNNVVCNAKPSNVDEEEIKVEPNQFVMLISNSNDKKTALVRFLNYERPLKKIDSYKKGVWGVRPKNKEQNFAMDLLYDENVPVISLIGKASISALIPILLLLVPFFNTPTTPVFAIP